VPAVTQRLGEDDYTGAGRGVNACPWIRQIGKNDVPAICWTGQSNSERNSGLPEKQIPSVRDESRARRSLLKGT